MTRRALLACALLCACERTGAPASDPPVDSIASADSVAPISCVAFTEEGLVFEASNRTQLQNALGPPLQEEARAAPGTQDSTFLVEYAGLVVSAHRPAGGSDLIDEVTVSDNRYLRFPQIGIGAPVDRVIGALGQPAESTDEQVVYACHSAPARDDPVTFRIINGRVAEVVFTYYMD